MTTAPSDRPDTAPTAASADAPAHVASGPVWSAPVRFAEVDRQGVVFNAHYLTWCDEALAVFLDGRGLRELGDHARLVASNLAWQSSAGLGDVIEVDAHCARVGATSFTLDFVVRVGTRICCRVQTTYVAMDPAGQKQHLSDESRAALLADSPSPSGAGPAAGPAGRVS